MKGEFYKMDFRAWNTGTVDLTLEQEAAYLRLCHAMYDVGGAVPSSARFLMSIFRCGNSKAAGLVRQLVKAGKIQRSADGMLTNRRVGIELSNRDRLSETRRAAGERGGKSRRAGDQSGPRVTPECPSSEGRVTPECPSSDPQVPASKSLKNIEEVKANASTLLSRGEEKREESPKAPKGAEPEGFAEFWDVYPRRRGDNPRKTALAAYSAVLRRGATHPKIMAGLRRYVAELTEDGKIGSTYVAQAATWLNQDRFERPADHAAPPVAAVPPAPVPDETWRERVREWKIRCGYWPWRQSPPPDHLRTLVPRHILAEFGLGPEAGPAEPQRKTGTDR